MSLVHIRNFKLPVDAVSIFGDHIRYQPSGASARSQRLSDSDISGSQCLKVSSPQIAQNIQHFKHRAFQNPDNALFCPLFP